MKAASARYVLGLVALLFGLLPTTAHPQALQWSFDGALAGKMDEVSIGAVDGQAGAAWCDGVLGKALVASAKGVRFEVPATFAESGALSFYYRLPAAGAKADRLELLRLGAYRLLYDRRRLVWVEGDRPGKEWSPRHSFLSGDRFTLIEIGWSAEQGCWIFADGLVATRMEGWTPAQAIGDKVALSFVEGVFDEVRLETDARTAGARFRGVLVRESFEKGLSDEWRSVNRANDVRLIDGFNGSRQALAGPAKGGPHFSIYLPLGFFRATEDMHLCMTVRSSNGKVSTCLVRSWPGAEAMKEHPNNWLRWSIPSDAWTPEKVPLARWGVKPGWIVQGVSLGSQGPEERWFAVDNVCLLRGADRTPPAQVAGLKAEVKEGAVRLSWQPAQDDVGVAGYVVYWSNVPQMWLDDRERVAQTVHAEFLHDAIPHPGTYYYAVAAIDLFGNVGKASAPTKVDVGD